MMVTNEERARDIAEQLFINEYPRNALATLIAAALDAAEQRGMARARDEIVRIMDELDQSDRYFHIYGAKDLVLAAIRRAGGEGEL